MAPAEPTAHPVLGSSPIPRYVRLADIFRQRIERGMWPKGQMLPTIEQLMEEFAVARVTVRQAVKLLSDEGLVSPRRGRGTLVKDAPPRRRPLRVHTTFAGLVDMYRNDRPVLTNIAESDAAPTLHEGDGVAAPSYFHMRRVHARDRAKYCVISMYIDERVFDIAPQRFRNEVVLPLLFSLPGVEIAEARQSMRISRADVEVASLLDVPVGEPMADVRRVLKGSDGTVIYVADVNYRGDHIQLDMDLKPDAPPTAG
jgi:GntR family transcriptional regulator